jgi:hypothetical protein
VTRPAPDWDALQGEISGDVILPGSSDYDSVRKPAIARFHDVRPQAVVLCETPADVSEAISFARRYALRAAPRSGGHCFAGRSSIEGIDVSPMRSVAVAGGAATVGAGARLGDVYDALAGHGLTIPVGCGPAVGISGLTLGGGLGILGPGWIEGQGLWDATDLLLGGPDAQAGPRDDHDLDPIQRACTTPVSQARLRGLRLPAHARRTAGDLVLEEISQRGMSALLKVLGRLYSGRTLRTRRVRGNPAGFCHPGSTHVLGGFWRGLMEARWHLGKGAPHDPRAPAR